MTKYLTYKKSGFIRGIGSVVDVFAVRRSARYNKIMNSSDVDALKQDWQNIGKDISQSIASVEKTHKSV